MYMCVKYFVTEVFIIFMFRQMVFLAKKINGKSFVSLRLSNIVAIRTCYLVNTSDAPQP